MIVARRLGYRFLDTGAMYRALTWFVLECGIDPTDEDAVSALAMRARVTVEGSPDGDGAVIRVGGRDATPFLTSPAVERAVSQVSKVPAVRSAMVLSQRQAADDGRIVMAGRDIGTVVLPAAELKVYLDASPGERAKRRHQQAAEAGVPLALDEVLADLKRRDELDSGRALSPLRPAADAAIINTDGLSLEQVVDRIIALLS
jgi:cytidylate kinase